MSGYIAINQVLMFKDPDKSTELGQALWSALKEVEAFYNHGTKRADFHRTFLSEVIPENIESKEDGFLGIGRFWDSLFKGNGPKKEYKSEADVYKKYKSEASWKTARGKFPQTYEAKKIVHFVRELLGEDQKGDMPIVLIDQELTPPSNWRYIIWEAVENMGAVASTVPIDPEYWQISDPNRIAVIKHRIRTACMQIVGRLLGLKYCSNENCFLFKSVDSIIRLDHMVELGPEHEGEPNQEMKVDELLGYGYEIKVRNPNKQHFLKEKPEPILEE